MYRLAGLLWKPRARPVAAARPKGRTHPATGERRQAIKVERILCYWPLVTCRVHHASLRFTRHKNGRWTPIMLR